MVAVLFMKRQLRYPKLWLFIWANIHFKGEYTLWSHAAGRLSLGALFKQLLTLNFNFQIII
jgi:hypothetical protein